MYIIFVRVCATNRKPQENCPNSAKTRAQECTSSRSYICAAFDKVSTGHNVSDKFLPLEHSHVHTVVIVFQLGDFSSMSAHLPSPLKAHGGHDEEAILRAQLSDKWGKYRACSCFIGTAVSFIFCPCGLAYLLCGGSCREEEQRSLSSC